MELRKLQATDLFTMVKIINGIGFKTIKECSNLDEINAIKKDLNDNNADEIASKVGVNVIMSIVGTIIENLPKVEQDVYTFCGNVAGIKPKDVARLEIGEFMDLLIEIFTKDEFKDFFKRASKLIK